jgi:hypothetical protein
VSLNGASNRPSSPSSWLTHKLRVTNPLADVSHTDLMHDVEVFCNERGLTERIDLIKRGALVAQNPTGYEHIETLSQSEREALRFEAAHRWRHPLSLYFTIIVCSIGAAVQGWDQTGSNGANLSFPTVGRTTMSNTASD